MTKSVTLNDNNAVFVCNMTSGVLPTAYHNYAAGPMIVQQTQEEPYSKGFRHQLRTPKQSQHLFQTPFPLKDIMLGKLIQQTHISPIGSLWKA